MLNYQTIYTTDCCGSYCENDTDICPDCYEHCEVVTETFEIADYVYFIANGTIAAEGTPHDLKISTDPFVKQFVSADPDGPVPFHYPGKTLAEDFGAQS